jgi:CPA2 family monovalent cation:H+ antiporter-2
LNDSALLRDIGIIVVAAAAFVALARSARVPSIVAYILAGLALGPLTGLVAVSEPLHLIAEVGIALLLFLVGLELSF